MSLPAILPAKFPSSSAATTPTRPPFAAFFRTLLVTSSIPTMQLQLKSLNATRGQTRVLQAKTTRPLRAARLVCRADAVFDKLKPLIVKELGIDDETKVTPAAKLIEDLDADSLDAVELIMKIEEEFDLEIPDEQAESMKTVEDIVNAIKGAKA